MSSNLKIIIEAINFSLLPPFFNTFLLLNFLRNSIQLQELSALPISFIITNLLLIIPYTQHLMNTCVCILKHSYKQTKNNILSLKIHFLMPTTWHILTPSVAYSKRI
jgi:Na+/phosphate symporter